MRISYRTHPVLEKLQLGKLGKVQMLPDEKPRVEPILGLMKEVFEKSLPRFRSKVMQISTPVMEAIVQALPKLTELNNTLVDTDGIHVSGTFLMGDFVYMIDHHLNKGEEHSNISFMAWERSGFLLAFLTADEEGQLQWHHRDVDQLGISPLMVLWPGKDYDGGNYQFFATIVGLFLQYAEVETKHLPAGQKVKSIECNYKNDTKLDITRVDSKWFTNLVKSDAFKVRGHFRLQPKKKEGQWTKELIWINDFMKDGYTAPARIAKK